MHSFGWTQFSLANICHKWHLSFSFWFQRIRLTGKKNLHAIFIEYVNSSILQSIFIFRMNNLKPTERNNINKKEKKNKNSKKKEKKLMWNECIQLIKTKPSIRTEQQKKTTNYWTSQIKSMSIYQNCNNKCNVRFTHRFVRIGLRNLGVVRISTWIFWHFFAHRYTVRAFFVSLNECCDRTRGPLCSYLLICNCFIMGARGEELVWVCEWFENVNYLLFL